jgi:DNA polymerase family A
VRVAVAPGASGAALLCELAADGSSLGSPILVPDLAEAVVRYERSGDGSVRWVWSCTAEHYPALLRAGVRVGRCHDVALAERLLLSREGRAGEPASLPAAWARLRGASVPAGLVGDGGGRAQRGPGGPDLGGYGPGGYGPDLGGYGLRGPGASGQGALFEDAGTGRSDPRATLDVLMAVHADQLRRIAADEHPARFAALVAAESAGGLAACEMTFAGMPWRADIHDELLAGMLGPRPPAALAGTRPARLAELAALISVALGGRPVNPDSPAQLIRALAAAGLRVPSTRVSVLREIDHPAIGPLLEYKELARLHAAHGWAWLDAWVSGGRFRPEYVVGGVVSGRWASRGGGALQIPRVLRRAVVADPGWVLVVADAAQLEPRVLAALAGDRAFTEAAAGGDLYEGLASVFGGDRGKAKIALLSAMYGGAGGEAGQLLAVLRRRFPAASGYVEAAARAGEEGRVVRSVLGRTCPPPSAAWRAITVEPGDPEAERDPGAGRAARARGRFTRNFVVQASAADWALVLLAALRRRLAALPVPNEGPGVLSPARPGDLAESVGRGDSDDSARTEPSVPGRWDPRAPHLVFFQHDEVLVHCPAATAQAVVAAVAEAAAEAGRTVFGVTQVRFPMTTAVVSCYADAK